MIGLELKIREVKRRRIPPPERPTRGIPSSPGRANVPGELESEA